MPEYGDYKKEIKTLGDLRTFVNETLKDIEDNYTFDIEDNYTFDIDDDFMGIDIILTANCDVSYSEKSFYWTANVNYATEIEKVVDDRIKAKHKIKALEIIKEKLVDVFKLYTCKTVEEYNQAQYRDCKLTEEEFNILKENVNENN